MLRACMHKYHTPASCAFCLGHGHLQLLLRAMRRDVELHKSNIIAVQRTHWNAHPLGIARYIGWWYATEGEKCRGVQKYSRQGRRDTRNGARISSLWRAKTGDPALFFLSRRRPQPMNLSHACQKRVRVRHELRFVALQQQARLDDHADCAQPHHTLEAKMEAGLLVPVGRVFRGVWRYDFKFCKFSACCSSSSGQQYDLAAQCST